MMEGCSIIITTRNRIRDLAYTLEVCHHHLGPYDEVIVIDDGSTDETASILQTDFPWVRTIHHKESLGLISRRNEGARLAKGDYLVSLDDDSYFLDDNALEKTRELFAHYPNAGALAYDIYDPVTRSTPLPDRQPDTLTTSFVGCGYAVRRELFLQLSGYRDFFVYGGEETDFCLRLMNMGFAIIRTEHIRVFHAQSQAARDVPYRHTFAFRNQLCQCLMNEPVGRCFLHLLSLTYKGFVFAIRHNLMASYLRAYPSFFSELPRCLHMRQPLKKETFKHYDSIRKNSTQQNTLFHSLSP